MIAGYAEIMRDIPGENTPENTQIIIDEANRLSELVINLLDISKIQSGVESIEKAPFNLTEATRKILNRYAKLREQSGYTILFEKTDDAIVDADQSRITQVIYNLINNAVNYCGKDKTVIVRQKIMQNKVRLEIIDHGKGIESDQFQYIWDRYYRIEKQHQTPIVGTGIGLSIVKSVLELHNAVYGVNSEPGKGSTFYFELELFKEGEDKK